MKTITVKDDGANLDITLDELIIISNSLNHVLSKISQSELHARTGFYPQEMGMVLNSIEQIIEEFQ